MAQRPHPREKRLKSGLNAVGDPSVIDIGNCIIQVVRNFADDRGAADGAGGDRGTSCGTRRGGHEDLQGQRRQGRTSTGTPFFDSSGGKGEPETCRWSESVPTPVALMVPAAVELQRHPSGDGWCR